MIVNRREGGGCLTETKKNLWAFKFKLLQTFEDDFVRFLYKTFKRCSIVKRYLIILPHLCTFSQIASSKYFEIYPSWLNAPTKYTEISSHRFFIVYSSFGKILLLCTCVRSRWWDRKNINLLVSTYTFKYITTIYAVNSSVEGVYWREGFNFINNFIM
jgi:hypothetical protein